MAVESLLVTSLAVEVSEYPDLIRQYRVNGVPKTVVNDQNEILGGLPEGAFVRDALAGLTGTAEARSPTSEGLKPEPEPHD